MALILSILFLLSVIVPRTYWIPDRLAGKTFLQQIQLAIEALVGPNVIRPIRTASSQRMISIAKRWQQLAVGVSPRNQARHRAWSREAAAAIDCCRRFAAT